MLLKVVSRLRAALRWLLNSDTEISVLRSRLELLEHNFATLRLDWDLTFGKMQRLAQRVTRIAKVDSDNQAVPASSSDFSPPLSESLTDPSEPLIDSSNGTRRFSGLSPQGPRSSSRVSVRQSLPAFVRRSLQQQK